MKINQLQQTTYLNTILINGQLRGLFYSKKPYQSLGSNRSIVEILLNEYHLELDIEIIAKNINTIPLLENTED